MYSQAACFKKQSFDYMALQACFRSSVITFELKCAWNPISHNASERGKGAQGQSLWVVDIVVAWGCGFVETLLLRAESNWGKQDVALGNSMLKTVSSSRSGAIGLL